MKVASASRCFTTFPSSTSAVLGAALCAALLVPGCASVAPAPGGAPGGWHALSVTDVPAGDAVPGDLAGAGATDGGARWTVADDELALGGALPVSRNPSPAAGDAWRYTVTPYVWMLGIEGKASIKGSKVDVDTSFHDILENLDLAAMVHVEAWNGDWGFSFDPTFGSLSADGKTPAGAEIDVDQDILIADAVALRHLVKEGDTQFDGLVGVRYWQTDTDLDADSLGVHESATVDWWDPIIGGRVVTQLDDWELSLRADVGGFGIGSAAEREWSVTAVAGYEVNPGNRVGFGYRWLNIDKTSEDGATETGLNGEISGPIIGWTFAF
jgi:hypothetical protein